MIIAYYFYLNGKDSINYCTLVSTLKTKLQQTNHIHTKRSPKPCLDGHNPLISSPVPQTNLEWNNKEK